MNNPLLGADVLAAQIDRLVSGDLPESDRRSLLAWLDEEPSRWRACALAFLEAQTWEQATAFTEEALTREGKAPVEPLGQGSRARSQDDKSNARIAWTHWLALAAIVLVAFGAGAVSAWSWPNSANAPRFAQPPAPSQAHSSGPLLATVSVRTNLDPRLLAQLKLPVEPAADSLAAASPISDYDRKLWERRGYELVEERRYLPAKMPDGRPVMVPVNRVHLKLKETPAS
jgi:anti-sigma factor RsiW